MGSFTNWAECKLLNVMAGNELVTSVSMWCGLFTAAPSDASGGTEVSGGSYARKSSGAWGTCTGSEGFIENVATITYATASAAWGSVSHFALLDDSSTGNMIAWATLTAARNVVTNDVAVFAVGSLTITLD
jgi:hypothetical protein